jgi:hypothetical protein
LAKGGALRCNAKSSLLALPQARRPLGQEAANLLRYLRKSEATREDYNAEAEQMNEGCA